MSLPNPTNYTGWLNSGVGTGDILCAGNLTVLGAFSASSGNSNVITINGTTGTITLQGQGTPDSVQVASNVTTDTITLSAPLANPVRSCEIQFSTVATSGQIISTQANPVGFTVDGVFNSLKDFDGQPLPSPLSNVTPFYAGTGTYLVSMSNVTIVNPVPGIPSGFALDIEQGVAPATPVNFTQDNCTYYNVPVSGIPGNTIVSLPSVINGGKKIIDDPNPKVKCIISPVGCDTVQFDGIGIQFYGTYSMLYGKGSPVQ